MRLCELSDKQLMQHVSNYRKIANWLGAEVAVSQTTGALAAAIEELVDRRAAATRTPLSLELEASFAYLHASGLIESHCNVPEAIDGDFEGWYDLDTAEVDLGDVITYLLSRNLLEQHPDHPRWVCIRDESEGD